MRRIIAKVSARPISERILFALGGLIFIFIFPVTIFRLIQQDWNIFFLDAFLVCSAALIFANAYRRKYLILMQFYLCTLVTLGAALTVIIAGPAQVYWIYPASLTIFFLVSSKLAFIFVVAISCLIAPTLLASIQPMEIFTIYLTLFATAFFINVFSTQIKSENANLNSLASKDFLTGCGNRLSFEKESQNRFNAFNKLNTPVSLIIIDIDKFKVLNDNFGHTIGDQVLQHFTETVNQRLRKSDTIYRLGGEEFAIVVANTQLEDAHHLALEIRRYINNNNNQDLPPYTVSMGVSELKKEEQLAQWVDRTDKAMYQSKEAGRDTVTLSK